LSPLDKIPTGLLFLQATITDESKFSKLLCDQLQEL
jgi:hypothetical protein